MEIKDVKVECVIWTQFRTPCFIRHSADLIPQHHSVSYTLASFRILTRPVTKMYVESSAAVTVYDMETRGLQVNVVGVG